MFICFEGPDFAGKSTTIKMLMDNCEFHDKLKDCGITKVQNRHFPNKTNKSSSYHVFECINKDSGLKKVNPYYEMNSFMTDFYHTIFGRDGLIDNMMSKDTLVILDRYYYSSIIMCPYWNSTDNLLTQHDYSNLKDESEIKAEITSIRNKLQQDCINTIVNYQLPAPDLNIVLLPSAHQIMGRYGSRESTDINELPDKLKANYAAYVMASTLEANKIFGCNGEKFAPVVIKSNNINFNFNSEDPNQVKLHDMISSLNNLTAKQVMNTCMDIIIRRISIDIEKKV